MLPAGWESNESDEDDDGWDIGFVSEASLPPQQHVSRAGRRGWEIPASGD